MTGKNRIISAAEAKSLLFDDDDDIHSISLGRMMIGCDWAREDVVAAVEVAEHIWLSDGLARAMAHPIVCREKNGRFSAFQADKDKVEAFERSRFGTGGAA